MDKYTVEENTIELAEGEIAFPIRAREGDTFVANDGSAVGIHEAIKLLCGKNEEQRRALEMLGIQIHDQKVDINFCERGKTYIDPEGDRTKLTDDIVIKSVNQDLNIDCPIPTYLPITYGQCCFIEDGINFFCSLTVRTPSSGERYIPITGRGTIALEGRLNDAHAGLCTGAACASFQARAAMTLAVAAASGASDEQIALVGDLLMEINGAFHGRDDILLYTTQCASKEMKITYMQWMKARYERAGPATPIQLETMINTGKPHPVYWDKVRQKFTEAEMEEDKLIWKGAAYIDTEESTKTKRSKFLCCWK